VTAPKTCQSRWLRLSLDELIRFDWEIALGDARLSPAELELLARLKAPLVKLRGQWVQLTAAEIQAALELWQKQGQGRAKVRDLLQMALGARTPAPGIEFGGVSATGWIAELLAQLEERAAFEELAPPAGFQGQLRPYQTRGYSWLAFLRRWGLGACLADDMGLGKTIQVLALTQMDWEANRRAPMLLVCPTSVTGNWQKEAARFTPQLPVLVHHGTERIKGAAFAEAAAGQALVVTSYSLLHRDLEMFKQVPWAAVVLDEAQNVKNPETKQAKAARALESSCRIALTGTPVENNVGDLWSIMEFLNPGFLGGQSDFKRRFFLPIQVERDPAAAAQLKRLTGPFILRRLKTDKRIIADLPDKLEMKVFCPLTKEQASLYQAVVQEAGEALEGSEGIQRKGLVLATLMKLKQVCNHPAQFLGDNSALPGRSGKLARLGEMLEEVLAVGERALVFTQFSEMGGLLQRHLQETFGQEALFLHGATPRKQRDRMVERFQGETGAPGIFVLSLKAGGTGLNLTRANHVFHFDRWWNPAVENQATDRAFRIGQTRNVQVHKFVCQGTLEDKIDEMIERKKEIAANVVGAGEGWLTELTNAELKELFALRAEAVQE
jgi:SNF2 family DNA or RNA helicase